jgi:hypothetical protein
MVVGSTEPLTEMSTRNISPGGGGCKGGRCVWLTNLPPLCANCLEISEPQTYGTFRACPDMYRDCFTCTMYRNLLQGIGLFGTSDIL